MNLTKREESNTGHLLHISTHLYSNWYTSLCQQAYTFIDIHHCASTLTDSLIYITMPAHLHINRDTSVCQYSHTSTDIHQCASVLQMNIWSTFLLHRNNNSRLRESCAVCVFNNRVPNKWKSTNRVTYICRGIYS